MRLMISRTSTAAASLPTDATARREALSRSLSIVRSSPLSSALITMCHGKKKLTIGQNQPPITEPRPCRCCAGESAPALVRAR